MFRYLLIIAACLFVAVNATGTQRGLIVVNSLGETADRVNLTDSTITHNVVALGLAPNKFLVKESNGASINSSSNDVTFYNLNTYASEGSIFLGNGRNPYGAALFNSSQMLVTNLSSSTVSKMFVAGVSVTGEHHVGKSPEGLVVVGFNAYICITNFDFGNFTYGQGRIDKYSLTIDTVVTSINVGTNPQEIVTGYDGFLYVVCTGDYSTQFGMVYKINPATDQVVDSVATGGSPGGIAVTRKGVIFLSAGGFSGNGEVYTVRVSDLAVLHGSANPLHTDLGVTSVTTVSDSTVISCNFTANTITELDSAGHIYNRFNTGDGPVAVAKVPGCYVEHGDANGDGTVATISDVVYILQYIFAGGPAPVTMAAGDANCDGFVNISDAIFTIQYIFAGGQVAAVVQINA